MKLPLLALSLAALLQAAPAAAQDVVRIRLAHSLSTTEPAHLAAEYFAKNIAQRTNNKVQVQVEAMTRDPLASEAVKAQAPRIRSALLMLFGAAKPADLTTREGKEKLQADVLAEMQKIMKEETGKPAVDAVYFTSFVMQ